MKHCGHSHWLSLCLEDTEINLLETDRISVLTEKVPHPDVKTPSFILFIDSTLKSRTLRGVFGLKFKGWCKRRLVDSEVHLQVDPSTVETKTPAFLVGVDFSNHSSRPRSTSEKCLSPNKEISSAICDWRSRTICIIIYYSRPLLPSSFSVR